MSQEHKEQWGTRLGVILAVAGSAVGLGNFLRFPGQAAQNGGGAFLIPYFCALLLLGIPIGWAEWTMGRYGGLKGFNSAPGVLGVVGRGSLARYLGVLGVLIPLGVSFYYVFIESWTMGYFFQYLGGGVGIDRAATIPDQTAASAAHYQAFTGAGQDGILFTGSKFPLVCFLLTFAINLYFVHRGLSRGIEKFCSWAMPSMAVCALFVLVRVLTLGTPDPAAPDQNVVNGLGFMWNPDFSRLGSFQTWLAAAGQVFFTLSVGFGVIINYASYLKRKSDIALSSLTASATNELFEVGFGGMITLTASVIFLGVAGTIGAVQSGSFALGFTTLPVVFAHMGALGNVVGAIWFLMLFLAAITSSLSMYQPAQAFLKESLGLSQGRATSVLVVFGLVAGGLTLWFTEGGAFWNTLDFWVGTYALFVMAMIQIIYFSWVFGIDRGWREMHRGAQIQLPKIFKFVMKWVAPAYLLVVFIGFTYQNLGDSLRAITTSWPAKLAIGLLVVTGAFIAVAVNLGEKRWRAAGLDLDDNNPISPEA